MESCLKLKSYGISDWAFELILSFLSSTQVVLDGMPSQEYLVNTSPTLFLLYCNIAIYADDTTLCSKCDLASHLQQPLELSSELESDLRDTAD